MNKQDILDLAALSRLEISDTEVESYKNDFDGIIAYIDTISSIDVPAKDQYQTNLTTNIMRSDDDVYEPGVFSEDILNEAPNREGDYFKVKKVL